MIKQFIADFKNSPIFDNILADPKVNVIMM
jgi:hypothetical protein